MAESGPSFAKPKATTELCAFDASDLRESAEIQRGHDRKRLNSNASSDDGHYHGRCARVAKGMRSVAPWLQRARCS